MTNARPYASVILPDGRPVISCNHEINHAHGIVTCQLTTGYISCLEAEHEKMVTHKPPTQHITGLNTELAVLPKSQKMISGGNQIKIWDISNLKFQEIDCFSLPSNEKPKQIIALPDEQHLLVQDAKNDIGIWNISQKPWVKLSEISKEQVCASTQMKFVISPNGRYLAGAKVDGLIGLWDLNDLKNPTYLAHIQNIHGFFRTDVLLALPDSRHIASIHSHGNESLLKIWDISQNQPTLVSTSNFSGCRNHFLLNADNNLLVTINAGEGIRAIVWDITNVSKPTEVDKHLLFPGISGTSIALTMLTPSGRIALKLMFDNTTHFIDFECIIKSKAVSSLLTHSFFRETTNLPPEMSSLVRSYALPVLEEITPPIKRCESPTTEIENAKPCVVM